MNLNDIKKWKYYSCIQKPVSKLLDPFLQNRAIKNNRHKFIPSSFIPASIDESENKIKVRILYTYSATWNSIVTICRAFAKDERYDVQVILGNSQEKNIKHVLNEGMAFVRYDKYCVVEDRPDVLIISHPRDNTDLGECRKYTRLIIAATMTLTRYAQSLDEYWKWAAVGFERFQPDFYLFDSLLYNEIKNSSFFSEKIVEMGNAKFDGIYEAFKKERYVSGWHKLNNRKNILWATDHGVQKGWISNDISFDIYAKQIFDYIYHEPTLGLIFRPHPTFVKEMISQGYWTEDDINSMKQWCNSTHNIVWDESDTYDMAYAYCDAILTDAFCGIMCSALPTLKPIGVMYRSDSIKPLHEELSECLYSIKDVQDLYQFFEMIKNQKDPMKEARIDISNKSIKNFDGKNGERIKQFIEIKLSEL